MTFGPVIEQLVTVNGCVGFDSGKLDSFPKELTGHLDNALLIAGMRSRGLDVIGDDDWGLLGVGLKVERLDGSAWDNLTPAQIKPALAHIPTEQVQLLSPGKDAPATYAFQTRLGGRGLLQVSSLAANPGPVKIRYTLVQIPP